ncbi:hypothetical protein HK405_004456 [Cladochytrium tenue]|nr:hypothetical protein HK405_004456 [Cladochytrium tenue]
MAIIENQVNNLAEKLRRRSVYDLHFVLPNYLLKLTISVPVAVFRSLPHLRDELPTYLSPISTLPSHAFHALPSVQPWSKQIVGPLRCSLGTAKVLIVVVRGIWWATPDQLIKFVEDKVRQVVAAAAKQHSMPVVVLSGLYKLSPVYAFDVDEFGLQLSPDPVTASRMAR